VAGETDIRVRVAGHTDYPTLRGFWSALDAELAPVPYERGSFEEHWPDADSLLNAHLVIVAESGGEPIGCVIGTRVAPSVGHVSGMYVRPEFRRRGTGRMLLAAIGGVFAERGIEHVLLDVEAGNPHALAFYEQLGFVDAGRRLTAPVGSLLS
jgi:ribosomal protein S18 acetylase RimI-like enzyme